MSRSYVSQTSLKSEILRSDNSSYFNMAFLQISGQTSYHGTFEIEKRLAAEALSSSSEHIHFKGLWMRAVLALWRKEGRKEGNYHRKELQNRCRRKSLFGVNYRQSTSFLSDSCTWKRKRVGNEEKLMSIKLQNNRTHSFGKMRADTLFSKQKDTLGGFGRGTSKRNPWTESGAWNWIASLRPTPKWLSWSPASSGSKRTGFRIILETSRDTFCVSPKDEAKKVKRKTQPSIL